MRSLRWVVLIAVMCAGTDAAQAQGKPAPKLKPEPKSFDDKMVWLRESIAHAGGFALNPPGSTGHARLSYEFHGQQSCQLSWRAVAAGDDDLLSLYPGAEQVEDLKSIVPESLRVLPVDVRGLLAGGTGQAVAGDTGVYWKITASYVDGTRVPADAFEFLFADMQSAQRVSEVLAREAESCQGAKGRRKKRAMLVAMPRRP